MTHSRIGIKRVAIQAAVAVIIIDAVGRETSSVDRYRLIRILFERRCLYILILHLLGAAETLESQPNRRVLKMNTQRVISMRFNRRHRRVHL